MNEYIDLAPEIAQAFHDGRAVVALESTIISHGMPYPENVKTAQRCEAIIREQGAVPATIAILDGRLKVGLTDAELDYLGRSGTAIRKTSRRDIAYHVAERIDGATTVSATMYIAHLAGIRLFATGGIGGVHRNAETTMDISADLDEFSKTPVTVVAAGAKSILDLGLTLEYLETKGVPVVGYRTDWLPAFYTDISEHRVNYRLDSPEAIANLIDTQQRLGLTQGILIANPIPKENALDPAFIQSIIDDALAQCEQDGIGGKETTPYLLGKIVELSEGRSLEANIALVYNNCRLAAEVAVALTKKGTEQ
jgi:pseudouridine-5'-phosphate glycosidase